MVRLIAVLFSGTMKDVVIWSKFWHTSEYFCIWTWFFADLSAPEVHNF